MTRDPGPPDVTIIGAGAVGLATALPLLEAGRRVEVIDRKPPASGASHGNAGVISTWSCVPQSLPGLWRSVPGWLLDRDGPLSVRPGYWPQFLPWALRFLAAGRAHRLPKIADAMLALSRPSLELYRQNLAGTGSDHLVRNSLYLHVVRHPAKIDLGGVAWRLREERGVPMRLVQRAELEELEPAIGPDYQSAVVIEGQGRALDPGAVGRAVAEKCRRLGADFLEREVTSIRPTPDGWELQTDRGARSARHLVLAAGAWSARLLAPLGVKLPLEAERGYHMMFTSPQIDVSNSIMDMSGKFVASQMNEGVRLAGTAEFAGLETPPNAARAEVFRSHAKRLFPEINTDETEIWMGNRPSFPDSLPCIGPVDGLERLVLAFGHSHYGFGMAPQTGRIVAGLITGAKPNIDLAPYSAQRFAVRPRRPA